MNVLPYPKDPSTNADGQFTEIQVFPAHARLYNPKTRQTKALTHLMQMRAMMVALDNQETLIQPTQSRIRRNGKMLSSWQLIDPRTNQTVPRIFTNFTKAMRAVGGLPAPGQPTTFTINPGSNSAWNPFEVPMTLGGCGIHTGNPATGLAEGFASTADMIQFQIDGGPFKTYYYSNGGFPGVGWREATDDITNQINTQLPVGVPLIITRRATGSFTWTPIPA